MTLKEANYNLIKEAVINKLLKKSTTLKQAAAKDWYEIYTNRLQFDRKLKLIQCIKNINFQQVTTFFNQHISQNNQIIHLYSFLSI